MEASPEAVAGRVAGSRIRRTNPACALKSSCSRSQNRGAGRRLSTSGGTEPVWSRDGRELFYLNGDAMMAVEESGRHQRSQPGAPRMLFEGRYVLSPNGVASYDVSADGRWFLRVQPIHADPPTDQIQVTLNWFEELKRLVPAK